MMEGRRGEGQSYKEEVRREWERGPWRAVLAFLPRGPEFQVTPLSPPACLY